MTDQGVDVHEQQPTFWEDHEARARFGIQLLEPADDAHTYVQLNIDDLVLRRNSYAGALPVATARRLRDELSARLDAVDAERIAATDARARALAGGPVIYAR